MNESVTIFHYHTLIMGEMKRRHYNVDIVWERPLYRGKLCDLWSEDVLTVTIFARMYG
jgi:uncharacterized protein (TIGR02328 family)